MPAAIQLRVDDRVVALNAKEEEELRELRQERDRALEIYKEAWLQLFAKAWGRQYPLVK